MKALLLTILTCLIPLNIFAQDTAGKTAFVVRVIDGKTLELADGEIVRLIGISPLDDAYEFTKRVENRTVRLEFDAQQKDSEGRLLAYLYFKSRFNPEIGYHDDDVWFQKEIFLNAEMIKRGYARPDIDSPNVKYKDLFLELYEEAKENQ